MTPVDTCNEIEAVTADECPVWLDLVDCSTLCLEVGDLCEGDGECGTDDHLNVCTNDVHDNASGGVALVALARATGRPRAIRTRSRDGTSESRPGARARLWSVFTAGGYLSRRQGLVGLRGLVLAVVQTHAAAEDVPADAQARAAGDVLADGAADSVLSERPAGVDV